MQTGYVPSGYLTRSEPRRLVFCGLRQQPLLEVVGRHAVEAITVFICDARRDMRSQERWPGTVAESTYSP